MPVREQPQDTRRCFAVVVHVVLLPHTNDVLDLTSTIGVFYEVANFELFAHFFSCDARTLALSTFILYTTELTDSQYRQKFSRKFFEERGGFFFGICTRKGVWF